MNIINNKNNPQSLNESFGDKINRLYESYSKSTSINQFLNENGNTEENQILYHFMSLNESQDANNRFTFENGMYIPGLGTKATGRLSLNNIMEESKTSEEFISNVSKLICEEKLMFTPSENDIKNLKESYDHQRNSMMI